MLRKLKFSLIVYFHMHIYVNIYAYGNIQYLLCKYYVNICKIYVYIYMHIYFYMHIFLY